MTLLTQMKKLVKGFSDFIVLENEDIPEDFVTSTEQPIGFVMLRYQDSYDDRIKKRKYQVTVKLESDKGEWL